MVKPRQSQPSKAWNSNTTSNNNNNVPENSLQFEGPSIFNEHAPAHEDSSLPPDMTIAPTTVDESHDPTTTSSSVLAVPMLPGVSFEPIYRQHRSASFSMGQDPAIFGYDNYDEHSDDEYQAQKYKTPLETMAEEEDDDEITEEEIDFKRVRSMSSGSALGRLSSSQRGHLFEKYKQPSSRKQQQQQPPDQSLAEDSSHDQQRPDPVRQLAEQLEAMQVRQQQQQQQHVMHPTASPMTHMIPPYTHHHHHHPHPMAHHPSAEMYMVAGAGSSGVNTPSSLPHTPTMPHFLPHDSNTTATTTSSDLGKGIPLHKLPHGASLYMVEFKAGRTDFFYYNDANNDTVHLHDLVIVEADRGKDLGKVAMENLEPDQVSQMHAQKQQQQQQQQQDDHHETEPTEVHVKRIYRQALPEEASALILKSQDEQRALAVCQQKTKQRKLPMEVVDAEYQWDRRKLTFYFMADRRIDFRELVRELFKMYKTRIWMCAVNSV
ncbi:psp1-domain-containing protein [Lichtheimia corymbifera JMRC:FSU:9682]|uniref:Psp1-domain-containing protein n=1 Tax=Lichtheimia corymbifera JMRC:FSU:9682 TaxID=1263082 RepID=A0A068S5J4_9FUNG|nr:psp1-domain-containing protein [Lichtheimia corymbifera JMRC:FSU:9682]